MDLPRLKRIYTDEDRSVWMNLIILRFVAETMNPNSFILILLSVYICFIRGQNPQIPDAFSLV